MEQASAWEPDWTVAVDEGETLLWTGRPEYGRAFWQLVGHEPVWYGSMAVAIAVMWTSLLLLPFDRSFALSEAMMLYAAITAFLVFWAYFMASQRQFVLSNLFYALTDRRAIVCKRGRDVLLRDGLYFVYRPLDAGYAYPLLQGRPSSSIRIGSSLSAETVQPFGAGLAHPGWNVLWGRSIMPIPF